MSGNEKQPGKAVEEVCLLDWISPTAFDKLHRPLQVGDRLVVCVKFLRARGSLNRIIDSFGGVAVFSRQLAMPSDLLDLFIGFATASLFQCCSRAKVELLASRFTQIFVEDLTNHLVAEFVVCSMTGNGFCD